MGHGVRRKGGAVLRSCIGGGSVAVPVEAKVAVWERVS